MRIFLWNSVNLSSLKSSKNFKDVCYQLKSLCVVAIWKYMGQLIINIVPTSHLLFQNFCWFCRNITIMMWCGLSPIILGSFIIVCESCDPIYLIKWKGKDLIHHEIEAPGKAATSLCTCSRWCLDKPSCMLLSWSPGTCWQVGLCGTLSVTGTVYTLKKDPIG